MYWKKVELSIITDYVFNIYYFQKMNRFHTHIEVCQKIWLFMVHGDTKKFKTDYIFSRCVSWT